MLEFISAREIAAKWNISQRRVAVLCLQNRIDGAMRVGNMWIIPSNANKPTDKRTEKYKDQKTAILKPFVKWAGGKGQLVGEIEKLLPKVNDKRFTKYCEPMVGGGALLFFVLTNYNFEQIYISDINAELINAYTVIKNEVDALVEKLAHIQSAYWALDSYERKNYYYTARKEFNSLQLNASTSIQKAALFIFLNKTCFNGLYRVNKKGQFNVPMGAYKKPLICDETNLRNISKALKKVTIVCGDYSLSEKFIDGNTFVYLDPPYRPISQTSRFTAYCEVEFDDNEQIRLAHFVNDINKKSAKIVLSNSDPQNENTEDKFFVELYKAYQINKVYAARAINSKSEKRGKIRELLICN